MSIAPTKLMTAEEFFDWANRPENRDRVCELDQGEIVEMSRPSELHCSTVGNIAWVMGNYVRQLKRGRVCPNDMGLVLERDPDTVRGADVAVYLDPKKNSEL